MMSGLMFTARFWTVLTLLGKASEVAVRATMMALVMNRMLRQCY